MAITYYDKKNPVHFFAVNNLHIYIFSELY